MPRSTRISFRDLRRRVIRAFPGQTQRTAVRATPASAPVTALRLDPSAKTDPAAKPDAAPKPDAPFKIVSWNLLRTHGASLTDVARLIERERPDLLLMQEATQHMEGLTARVGGYFARAPLPGRIHGPAMWSRTPWPSAPAILPLPSGTIVHRVCQILDLGRFAVANVHLSHGQLLNRRQLRHIAQSLPPHAAVLGDYNLVGPALLPGFRDVGPRQPTHVMGDIVPLRIDRCLVRGLVCQHTDVLPRERSDHCPIVVELVLAPRHAWPIREHGPEERERDRKGRVLTDTAGTAASRRRAAAAEGSVPSGSRKSTWIASWGA